MTRTAQGIAASIVLHGVAVALIALLSATISERRPPLSINLGLLQQDRQASALTAHRRRSSHRQAVQPEAASPEAVLAPAPEQAVVPDTPSERPATERPDTGSGASAQGDRAGQTEAENLRRSYVNSYFVFIRDRIIRNLTFPPVARKMGWSGKGMFSFVICRDGRVENIRILRSTGYDILDRNVVEAIQRTAPFPRPPVEAELTLPIAFKLI